VHNSEHLGSGEQAQRQQQLQLYAESSYRDVRRQSPSPSPALPTLQGSAVLGSRRADTPHHIPGRFSEPNDRPVRRRQ